MTQAQAQWWEQLKPGDEVGVVNHYRNRVTISKVQRVTPTGQIVLVGGSRFIRRRYRESPVRHGDTYKPDFLCPIEEAQRLIDQMQTINRYRSLVNHLRDYRWQDLSADKLERIKALVDELQPKPTSIS